MEMDMQNMIMTIMKIQKQYGGIKKYKIDQISVPCNPPQQQTVSW